MICVMDRSESKGCRNASIQTRDHHCNDVISHYINVGNTQREDPSENPTFRVLQNLLAPIFVLRTPGPPKRGGKARVLSTRREKNMLSGLE